MSKIKIISNPYQKKMIYQRWNESAEQWITVDLENNENSRLLSDELTTTFFPFIVQKIVDVIVNEYQDDSGKIEIVFEGTDDEYKDLQEICAEDKYQCIVKLAKGERYLENARDILPDIKNIFESIKPLIATSFVSMDKIAGEIKRFTDASEDKIPICILGNYSSGKSTFINALIGREILPSGDEPITAKIYKIERSQQSDRAYVEFECTGEAIKIRFEENNYRFTMGTNEKSMIRQLNKELGKIKNESLTIRVNRTIEFINSFVMNADEDNISDLIKITVPFVGGIWEQTSAEFVIFDTPGSNSASNNKHFQVLKKAMEGFSNGLPVYVSEFDALDSTDNETLYQEIRNMKELDDRFTMIIVNKADVAKLPKGQHSKEDEERILSLTIPRNLYSEGIYFVSSIMGLGSKNNGAFVDEHYAEIFEDQEQKYSNSSSRFHKSLYRYNIMPDQLKRRIVDLSGKYSDALYANSGLYAIEQEIQTFAGKYSAYNKCQQSHLFLGRVIHMTSQEIEDTIKEREAFKQKISEELDRDRKELLEKIENKGNELESASVNLYDIYMRPVVDTVQSVRSVEELEEAEDEFIKIQMELQDYDETEGDWKDARQALYKNFKENIAKILKAPNKSAFKEIGADLVNDARETSESDNELKEKLKNIYNAATDELLREIISDFTEHSTEVQNRLEEESKGYWEEKAIKIKNELAAVVTESSTLTEERKEELTEIIFDFEDIIFEATADDVFIKEEFEKGFRFGNVVIGKSERLNIDKLAKKYNAEMAETIQVIYAKVRDSHRQSLKAWKENLLSLIRENIVEYNPTLRDQSRIIKETTSKIEELEKRRSQLNQYTENIWKMMDWIED